MKLSQWLSEAGMTRRAFAAQLGVHEVTVSKWVSGHMAPRDEMVAAIERLSEGKVTANDLFAQRAVRQAEASGEAA